LREDYNTWKSNAPAANVLPLSVEMSEVIRMYRSGFVLLSTPDIGSNRVATGAQRLPGSGRKDGPPSSARTWAKSHWDYTCTGQV